MPSTSSKSKTTLLTREQAQADRKWWVVDLEGKTLGRAATRIAHVLRGKHKPTFTPHQDCGDFVVVLNADKLVLTGNKMQNKQYHHHTGYFGGLVSIPADKLLAKHPDRLVESAVWGMLPKGPLGRRIIKKLKIYSSGTHDHQAQQPQTLDL